MSDARRPARTTPALNNSTPVAGDPQLAAIHEASQRLQLLLKPADMAQEVIKVLEEILAYEYAAVLLVDDTTKLLVPFALSDQGKGREFIEEDKKYISSFGLKVGDGITGWVARHGESQIVNDVRKDPRYVAARGGIRSELCVPIQIGEKTIGVINIETTRPDAYDETDRFVLETVASQFAISYLAVMDLLTAACNRGCFSIAADREFRRARRFGRPLSLLMLDVDRFKDINDAFGHAFGDYVLRVVSECILAAVRDADLVGRYGGDEFVVLLTEADAEHAGLVAARLRESLNGREVALGPARTTIAVSLGAATLTPEHGDIGALIEAADRAMYREKRHA